MARFPSVGEQFGDYRITGTLGRGGMGVVFAAEQRGLARTVALKVLAPELAEQPDYRRRFAHEASVLARLDSPHIIQVYDHGEQDGCLYIATQYVAGGDLSEAMRRHGAVPTAPAAHIAAQVAWALADAHAAGIVHRDLKPSNVLLRNVDGADVFAYLCDFGIAQDRSPGLTAPGAVAGTFAYLAPERLRGEPATPSADLYALGCVLWTALTNSTPYAGSDVQIGMSHLSDPVPQLAPTSPVARAVNDVLRQAMAKEPAQRYPSANAMRSALQELARLAQTTPHPPLVPDRATSPGPPPPAPPRSQPSHPSQPSAPRPAYPAQPSHPSHPAAPTMLPFRPPPPAPKRHRTALVVGAVVAAVVLIAGTVAAVATRGPGDDPSTTSTSSSEPTASDPTTEPTEPTEPMPPSVTAPTYSPTPPPPPPTSTGPTPTYPAVPPATGIKLQVGRAEMRAPAGWGRVTQTNIPNGVGSRDYSDYEGYYSSVFLERTEPVFPLESLSLLEIVAMAAVESLAEKNADIELVAKDELPAGWLDGAQAARVRGVYKNTGTGLYFAEESWFVQKGKFLYRLTFQHSRADSLEERRADIDPVVVSFRWR
ncbi:serine/threonine protein kinase [Nocardioides sp. cx-169]|uniref:serine/threonine-protein kinase n=1 Tax=Nocardioides sp. cx-169 TaxID=2899080 RepID=UPI001E466302|nr:serine/threonine-protein kinase [Nocardioides sp. cx-169]MCD4533868.1 serine/threonine protein kinase [Nocardioides sp. cx-169]